MGHKMSTAKPTTADIPEETIPITNVNRITENMSAKIDEVLKGRDPMRIIDKPSQAAMEGSIFYAGKSNHIISPTRPSPGLRRRFERALKRSRRIYGFQNIWYPPSLAAWSYGIIFSYAMRNADLTISPSFLLGIARFGEAQLCGASEEVMEIALKEMLCCKFRTHQQWRELVDPENVVYKAVIPGFEGDMIRIPELGPSGEACGVHELQLPYYAQITLQTAFENVVANKIRKIHHQAVIGKVDVKDLEDENVCSICLMEYEADECNPKIVNTGDYDSLESRQPVKVTCGHNFGTTCIEKWLDTNDSCPLCRATLTGKNRKMKPITQPKLSAIRTYKDARILLHLEGIEWDPEWHTDIENAISCCTRRAVYLLKKQFESLKEIDLRLGIPKTHGIGASNDSTTVAEWMNEDWKKFEENLRAQLDLMTSCGYSYIDLIPTLSDIETMEFLAYKLIADNFGRR